MVIVSFCKGKKGKRALETPSLSNQTRSTSRLNRRTREKEKQETTLPKTPVVSYSSIPRKKKKTKNVVQ